VFTLSSPVTRWARQRGREGRSPWLLAAALVVAVPGFLVTACSAQGSAQGSGQGGTAAAAGSAETATAADSPAVVGTTTKTTRRVSSAHAVKLLNQAAQAAIAMSYQGEEVVTRWTNGSGSVLVSNIWHVSGGQTVTQTLTAGTAAASLPYLTADSDSQAPEGVLGVTQSLVQLLETNYVMVYAGAGSADTRTAQVIEARRADGTLAARFWLDDATKLPLERVVFDSDSHVISQDVFLNLQFASQSGTAVPAGAAAAAAGPWEDPLSHTQLLALRSRGWQVPAALPGGLTLFTGAQTATSTGTVLDLGYSDGLSVVSVFEQRGHLAAKLAGWQKVKLGGQVVYVALPDQRSLTWSSRDMVYTVMADAPTQTVDAAIGALPHDTPPGFFKRMSRGFVRLASWVNPFR
jgi:sigma-E factor negative regulatory protein RseB